MAHVDNYQQVITLPEVDSRIPYDNNVNTITHNIKIINFINNKLNTVLQKRMNINTEKRMLMKTFKKQKGSFV
jgi:hypothetical protein